MQAAATNVVGNGVPAGAPNAPATRDDASDDDFAQLLAALGHQFADKSAPELLTADKLSNPDSTPAANANPSAAGTLGVNLHALLAALHGAATKPTNSAADSTKLQEQEGADSQDAANATTPARAATQPLPADPGTQLSQLLAVVPQVPPVLTGAVPEPRPTDTLAPTDAPAGEVAAAIVANGTAVKPIRAPGATESNAAAESDKSQAQSSTAGALAALATASERKFVDPLATTAASVRGDGGPATDNHAPGNGSRAPADNAHSHIPSAASDALAAPVPPAAVAATNLPAHTPTPASDATTLATANAASASVPSEHSLANAVHAELQLTHANPLPDTGALAITIAARSQAGARHFDIRLDPPELGRVDVHLTLDNAGKTLASLSVEKPQTLELLQKDSSSLERALRDAGLDLSQNGLSFSLKGQQHNGNEHSPATRGRALSAHALVTDEISAPSHSLSGVGASQTRLDIRV